MMPAACRLPFAPLERAAACVSRRVLEERLGVSYRTVQRLVVVGLSDEQADEYAVRAGLHPLEVWGDAWR
jgi:hypothetical protein